MADTTGKFVLVDGDNDNFDKIMVAIGVSAELREFSRNAKPTLEVVRKGDGQGEIITSVAGMPEKVQPFKIDTEQEETALGGRKVKCTYKRNGLTLITHEKQEDGQVVVYERELKGDEMHVKVTLGNLVALRKYKKA